MMQKIKERNLTFEPSPNLSCKPNHNFCCNLNSNSNYRPNPSYYLDPSPGSNPNTDHYITFNPNCDTKHHLNSYLYINTNVSNDPNNYLNLSPNIDVVVNPSPGYIDPSVGALVWVRRRNGSWWPGRILGPEELPASHLMSPRAGTPVKLLGREDGSVDWYNIEKSRRVKAFRCGEFDQCIQKALSQASALSKKREKYARREDAILHALELEKKHSKESQILGGSMCIDKKSRKMSDFGEDSFMLDEDINMKIPRYSFQGNLMDPENLTGSGQASLDSIFDSQVNQSFLHPEWDDDDVESIGHVRDLQDFELNFTISKESTTGSVNRGTPMCSLIDPENCSSVSRKNVYHDINIIEDEIGSKKRRLIADVHQSSLKLGDCAVDFDSEVTSSDFIQSVRRNENILETSVVADEHSFGLTDILSFGGRPHKLKYPGAISVDPFLQGNSASRASFFCGTGYSRPLGVTDADIEMTRSFTMDEKIAIPPLNFNIWPIYSHREGLCEKLANDFALRSHKSGNKMDPDHGYSLENNIPIEVPATYSSYNYKLDEKSISAYDNEDNLMFHICDMGNQMVKPSTQMFKQCLSVVEEEERERERCLIGEDEADSFQPISGPSLSSPEGVDMHDSSIEISKKCDVDSFSSFYDPYEEISEVQGSHDSAKTRDVEIAGPYGNWGTCDSANIMNSLNGCKITDKNTLSKWKTKGKRQYRFRRIEWRCMSIGSKTESHYDGDLETEEMAAVCNPISMRKTKDYVVSNVTFDSKENIYGSISCSSGLGYNKNASTGQAGCVNSSWIDVQVKVQNTVRQKAVLISVCSKLNGKPILGHQIQVEVIQKGHRYSHCSNKPFMHPAWKTARRTTMQHIPRCILAQDCVPRCLISRGCVPGAEGNLKEISKTSGFHVCPAGRKRKKPLKKLALVPKTRMPSSMATQHLDTNMEPKVPRSTIVTCVPVSVLFNRIREVLYRGSNGVLSDSDNI